MIQVTNKFYKSPTKYKVNHEQFCTNFTPISCYILGLIWADGYIKKYRDRPSYVIFSTTFPDSIYFSSIFKQTGEWKSYTSIRKNLNHKPSVTFYTWNPYLAEFLFDFGYESKSQNGAEKILSIIPQKFHKFFFLGLVDGDGCFCFSTSSSFNIASSFEQDWNFVLDFFLKNKIQLKIIQICRSKGKSSYIYTNSKKTIIEIGNLIYSTVEQDKIGLPRKINKFNLIKTSYRPKNNKSDTPGVCFDKTNNKWMAYLTRTKLHPKKTLGRFDTKQQAIEMLNKYQKNLILPLKSI